MFSDTLSVTHCDLIFFSTLAGWHKLNTAGLLSAPCTGDLLFAHAQAYVARVPLFINFGSIFSKAGNDEIGLICKLSRQRAYGPANFKPAACIPQLEQTEQTADVRFIPKPR